MEPRCEVEGPFGISDVAVGESLEFGRAPGAACVSETDLSVSERHGLVTNNTDSWSVTSTGSYLGFSVHDVATAAGFEIAVGMGPITVPFAHAIIVVAGRGERYALSVTGPAVVSGGSPVVASGSTIPIVDRSSVMGRDGRPLRWFQALVALCEPSLANPGVAAGSVASDAEIRRRLGIGSSTLERALTRARDELGFAAYTPQLRVVMATTAINQGVVSPADLELLG